MPSLCLVSLNIDSVRCDTSLLLKLIHSIVSAVFLSTYNLLCPLMSDSLFTDFFYPQEINLDLVQFPEIVYISEVRIIPLGARVQADFPGGVRLG